MAVKIENYESILENLAKNGKKCWEFNRNEVNPIIFNAYCASKANKMELLNISGSFWAEDIPEMVKTMKAEGVTEFTMSDSRCRITEIIAVFENNGAKLQGLTYIDNGRLNGKTGEPEMTPAFLMRIQ